MLTETQKKSAEKHIIGIIMKMLESNSEIYSLLIYPFENEEDKKEAKLAVWLKLGDLL